MISKVFNYSLKPLVKRSCKINIPTIRFLSTGPSTTADVVIPEVVESLEWLLSSPPPVHQFEEPPIVVEIEHLENLKPEEIVWED